MSMCRSLVVVEKLGRPTQGACKRELIIEDRGAMQLQKLAQYRMKLTERALKRNLSTEDFDLAL